ncbi:phage tail tape measure protein [Psychrobacillus sp. FSL K6-1267]|uniref:phage tail tape measure protein n=1 Tax=Psychrobacillus sp. FSL K6-1267 TaxID=2921543 RepID=UPI0030F88816
MARRSFEMSFQIGGQLARSFTSSFSNASNRLSDLNQEARRTQRELDRLGNDFRQGRIHQTQYAEATERLTREMRQLEASQRRVSAVQGSISKGFGTAKMVGGMAAAAAATSAVAVGLSSLNTAADFESKMSAVSAKTQATNAEMKALNQTALELGAKSSLSASEVAVAMDELAAKGFDANKIIGAMPGIIAAAEASGEELALTSDTVATAINVWSLEASQASRVADILAMSANVSAAGVDDLAQVFKYAGAPAAALGLSLEEVSAAAGIMTDAGLDGSNAGTALRASLLALNNPAKAQEKMMKKLGFSIKDTDGNAKSLSNMVKDLAKSTEHMTEADKVATIGKLVGTEAVSGFLALIKAGPEKIDKMTESLESSGGSAAKAAAIMKDNYSGSLEQLGGSIESAKIAFATPILPVFQDLFQGFGDTIDGNMGTIERAGEKVAATLRDVLDPFSTKEPVKPVLMDVGSIENYNVLMEDYRQNLEKYNKFSGMDFGDKFVFMLDTAAAKMESWLSGSGGESMEKIFTKLGEIAANAWYDAFTMSVKSAGSNLMEGNVMPALGMGAAAWMLGGGAMVKGAIGLGKWGYGKAIKGRSGSSAGGNRNTTQNATSATSSAGPITTTNTNSTNTARGNAASRLAQNGRGATAATTAATTAAAKPSVFKSILGKTGSILKPLGKVAGKAALPLTLATSVMAVASSKDKKKSAVSEGTGIAGGVGGAKLGAAIGTMIAPGIGTAVGGVLGGIVGYVGGKWAGGKAVDKGRELSNSASNSSNPSATKSAVSTGTVSSSSAVALDQTTTNLKNSIELTTNNFKVLTMHTGEASGTMVGSFLGIKSSADKVRGNLDLLTMYAGEASGWLVSLNGIQAAGQGVINSLNNLKSRIDNVQLPGVSDKRVSFNG